MSLIKEHGGNGDNATITLQANTGTKENLAADGHYHVVCRDKDGNVKWEDGFENQVMQVGKILAMNTLLYTASGYTLVGPYLGLITSATGYSPTDTMAIKRTRLRGLGESDLVGQSMECGNVLPLDCLLQTCSSCAKTCWIEALF